MKVSHSRRIAWRRESQYSWISWQDVFKAVVSRSMKIKKLRVSEVHHREVYRLIDGRFIHIAIFVQSNLRCPIGAFK